MLTARFIGACAFGALMLAMCVGMYFSAEYERKKYGREYRQWALVLMTAIILALGVTVVYSARSADIWEAKVNANLAPGALPTGTLQAAELGYAEGPDGKYRSTVKMRTRDGKALEFFILEKDGEYLMFQSKK